MNLEKLQKGTKLYNEMKNIKADLNKLKNAHIVTIQAYSKDYDSGYIKYDKPDDVKGVLDPEIEKLTSKLNDLDRQFKLL